MNVTILEQLGFASSSSALDCKRKSSHTNMAQLFIFLKALVPIKLS
jgi:hypothetical protein